MKAILASAAILLTGCERAKLDEEVRTLCAADGGVKVFEVVQLPREQFNSFGEVNFYHPTKGELALGPEYLFKQEIRYLRRGNPMLMAFYFGIVRRSDGKLLGESHSYSRGGGDIPGPWYESGYNCPPSGMAGDIPLLKAVFQPLAKK